MLFYSGVFLLDEKCGAVEEQASRGLSVVHQLWFTQPYIGTPPESTDINGGQIWDHSFFCEKG